MTAQYKEVEERKKIERKQKKVAPVKESLFLLHS